MRFRSSNSRVDDLKRWIKKHPDADWKEFVKQTGGTQSQFYHIRNRFGLSKANKKLSETMKEIFALKKKDKPEAIDQAANEQAVEAIVEARQKENEEYLAGPTTKAAPEIVVEGVTPDFIWYEMDLMQRKLSDVSNRLNHVMRVAQARDNDQKKMMRELISENSELRVQNRSLVQQVAEFTEMINGTPV